ILKTQGKMLVEKVEKLQVILINGHEEMEKSNNKTVKAVQEMQNSIVEELNQIHNEISTSMTNINRNLNERVKKAEQETRDLVSYAKHETLVTTIIYALKYGAAANEFQIPVHNLIIF